ncbi:MAG: MBOAT family O-acyltransferase [Myxococcota bacterium]
MLFNSLEFALFFPVVLALNLALPRRVRWVMLLVASYAFYMAWHPAYGLLLAASTALDWAVGRVLGRLPPEQIGRRRAALAVSLCGNLGMLFAFKYYNLVNGTFVALAARAGLAWPLPETDWLLPVGISFYTFQTMSYAIDVYRGRLAPEPNLGRFALFVSFFPQLVAGPIERAGSLLPQLRAPSPVDRQRIASGLRLAAWGLFKKVVVADRLSGVVDTVFADPGGYSGVSLVITMLFFTYQLYCDFSGYSDMAIGLARTLGVDLMQNFDQPHGSRSMTEMWTRWHISLSTWFRDYLYVPLGGNRTSQARWVLNMAIVFLVSGLWHGAAWRLAAWGGMHAVLVIGERLTGPARERLFRAIGLAQRPRLRDVLGNAYTFVLWIVTLVPFRADSVTDAATVFRRLPLGWAHALDFEGLLFFLSRVHLDLAMFLWCLALMPLVELVDWARRPADAEARFEALPLPVRWGLVYAVAFGVLLLGHWNETPFVYFQF